MGHPLSETSSRMRPRGERPIIRSNLKDVNKNLTVQRVKRGLRIERGAGGDSKVKEKEEGKILESVIT